MLILLAKVCMIEGQLLRLYSNIWQNKYCLPCARIHLHSTKGCLARISATLTLSVTLRQVLEVMSSIHLAVLD